MKHLTWIIDGHEVAFDISPHASVRDALAVALVIARYSSMPESCEVRTGRGVRLSQDLPLSSVTDGLFFVSRKIAAGG